MATYLADVNYIENSDSGLIRRNAAEFTRMRELLESVEPDINRATDIEWESVAREHYEGRIKDAKSLIENLGEGFRRSSLVLEVYAAEVEKARDHVDNGIEARASLRRVLNVSENDDPMRRYEELTSRRGSTGWPSWFPFLPHTRTSSEILEEAGRYYRAADSEFFQAKSVEQRARENCLTDLRSARAALPDFRGGDFKSAHNMVSQIEALQTELAQARAADGVRLPGSGMKDYLWPTDSDAAVSNKLAEINQLAATYSAASQKYAEEAWLPGKELEWVRNNQALIANIAARSGIPPAMLAAILLKESDDGLLNDGRELVRSWGFDGGNPDQTSYGPMEIQIRRGAEVLGYDPQNLTDDQRDQIRSALNNPVKSLYIAAEYMEQLKASSEFADVPADQMTDENYRELAQRYNGGPNYESDDAKKYGREFEEETLGKARDALK